LEQLQIQLPPIGKSSEIPTPEEYEYWRAADQRVYYVDYEIDEDYSLIELSKTIVRLNFEEKDLPKEQLKPIYIFCHSYGGDLEQAFYFCDLIKSSRIPIVTVAMGVTMSAGFLIFVSGHKRYAFPHSVLLIHSGSATLSGTAEQIEEAQNNYKRQQESMKKLTLENTAIDEKLFQKNSKKDWYLSGEELIKYSIADELITDLSVLFE
jgi:ATP-dependent Clp protease protease subunit